MTACFVFCARPPTADILRGEHGPVLAREFIDKHHAAFHDAVAAEAMVRCVEGDECLALFDAGHPEAFERSVRHFVRLSIEASRPDTAAGVALGEFDAPETTSWSSLIDCDDVAAARALARIALRNQVLATAAACPVSIPGPAADSSPTIVSRRLHGLRQPLDIVVAPWGTPEEQRILNLPILRPELKALEAKTADLLIAADHVRDQLNAFQDHKTDSNLTRVRQAFKRLVQKVDEMMSTVVERSAELRHCETLLESLKELQALCGNLPNVVDEVAVQLREGNLSTTAIDLVGSWDDVVMLLQQNHLDADKMILDIDDGLAVGQPPAWRR